MNLLYLKYAVEIASCGSLNKAAEKLYVGQPNLSRALKELEASLGVSIFERSAKGMIITPDGEIFLKYAQNILSQVDAVEHIFKDSTTKKKRFTVSGPRSSYISEAFTGFSKRLAEEERFEAFYKETNSMKTLRNVLQDDFKLGIVRYAEAFDHYYKDAFDEKELCYELITEFRYVLIMGKDSPLAKKDSLTYADLADYIEIAHADPYVPSLPLSEVKKEEIPEVKRRIYVYERASQFSLLSENINTFMWVSPVPKKILEQYGLVQRICNENRKIYKDVIIYQNNYKLTELDKAFISELCRVKREVIDTFQR